MSDYLTGSMKKHIKFILFLFVDEYSYTNGIKSFSKFLKLSVYSLRYKLASKGLFLTKSEKLFAKLKNKYAGQRCFIIGNGPSLNLLDLTKLKDEKTFGVNAIYLNYDKMKFHPTFYVVEDYLVAEDRANEINTYKGPDYKFWGTYLDYVLKKDPKTIEMNVLMNYSEPFEPFFSENVLRNVGVGGSVTYVCLQLAYYLGFTEVYMIGFDHNYKVKTDEVDNNNVILSKEDDINHFAPGYFGKGYRWHDPKVERMTQGFQKAKDVFEFNNRKIFNATAGGHLETFERVNYDDLFN